MKLSLLLLCISYSCLLFSQTYQNAESVEYDPANKRWLVANGDNVIMDDGYGNLSFLGSAGASHGMEVMGSVLYAIDNNVIRAYDPTLGTLFGFLNIPGASFLNGMTNDGAGNLYVTDFSAQKIHRINASDFNNMSSEVIVENTQGTPNGIVYDAGNTRLLFVTWGANASIKAVDLNDNSVSTIVTTNLTNIDGIDEDNEGNYYISSWSPDQISKFDKDFANPLEVITTPFINNPADIGYALQTDTLAIPVGNDVIFVGLADSTTSASKLPSLDFNFIIYPNPVSHQSSIQFELKQQTTIELDLLDQQGRLIQHLLHGNQLSGPHKVLFAGHNLTAGIYYCRLKIAENVLVRKVLIADR